MSNILVNQLTGNTTDTTIEVFAGHAADSTTRTNLEQGLCKAWCFLDGYDAAIHDSFNVSHETDEGTGAHQVSFTSNMNNVTFAIANNRSRSDTGRTGYDEMTCNDKATDGFSLNTSQTSNNNGQDNSVLDAHIMGDLA
tara:strand:- start:587 stop:1003 length:417 start_codon:yes stop_codon:yes gene_type:complete